MKRPPGARRASTLTAIHEHPGLGLRQLARLTGTPPSTLETHLRRLERDGRVWTTRHGPRVLHFPAPAPRCARGLVERHGLDDTDRALIAWLRRAPRCQKDVLTASPAAGLPRSCVQHRLRRLVRQGFLNEARHGRRVLYAVDDEAWPDARRSSHACLPVARRVDWFDGVTAGANLALAGVAVLQMRVLVRESQQGRRREAADRVYAPVLKDLQDGRLRRCERPRRVALHVLPDPREPAMPAPGKGRHRP